MLAHCLQSAKAYHRNARPWECRGMDSHKHTLSDTYGHKHTLSDTYRLSSALWYSPNPLALIFLIILRSLLKSALMEWTRWITQERTSLSPALFEFFSIMMWKTISDRRKQVIHAENSLDKRKRGSPFVPPTLGLPHSHRSRRFLKLCETNLMQKTRLKWSTGSHLAVAKCNYVMSNLCVANFPRRL